MKTTLEDQVKTVQKIYSKGLYNMSQNELLVEVTPDDVAALNDAGSSLLSLRIMVDDPKVFKKQLRSAIVSGKEVTITENVMMFLRSKGFPV